MNAILATLAELLSSIAVRKFVQRVADAVLNLLIEYVQDLLLRRRAGGLDLAVA